MLLAAALCALALGLIAFAAASDVATMTIPNWVSLVLTAAFPLAALTAGATIGQVGAHLAFGFVILLVGFGMFQAGVLGGGDVKVISAFAVWTGATAFTPFMLTTVIAGGVLAVSLFAARKAFRPMLHRPRFINRLLDPRKGAPYGVAIAYGAFAAAPAIPLFRALSEAGVSLTLL
jgi:prepilin peptidase CpaA